MKTLNQILEFYSTLPADEQDFVDQHGPILKIADRNGNGDDLFQATNIKSSKRFPEHGYEPDQSKHAYDGGKAKDKNIPVANKQKLARLRKEETELNEELNGKYTNKTTGTITHYKDGKRHREDGPAVEFADGSKEWYLNGKIHREDGSAIESVDGSKYWCRNGRIHREDGPAVEFADGHKEWYLNGKEVSKEQHARLTKKLKEETEQLDEFRGGAGAAALATALIRVRKKRAAKRAKYNDVQVEETELNEAKTGRYIDKSTGTITHYKDGKLHREDGPAVERADGSKIWYKKGKLHREDGPAVEYASGSKYWYLNGKRHREDGPAVEHVDGPKIWYKKGKLHREDGPAVEYADGTKYWYLNGKEVSKGTTLSVNKETKRRN